MAEEEMGKLTKEDPVLTPEDGFRLVVRLMRRYINEQQMIRARFDRNTSYGYSAVRFNRKSGDQE